MTPLNLKSYILLWGLLMTSTVNAETIRRQNPHKLYDPRPNGYSHVTITNRAGLVAHIAGQGGEDRTGRLASGFRAQVKQAYQNLRTVLDEIGAAPEQVLKLNTYVVAYDETLLPAMTETVQAHFGNKLPAQTLIPVERLALDGMLFEVDAVVWLEPSPTCPERQQTAHD